jgi:hypothetical protein
LRHKLNGSRPSAFISSTFQDLYKERELVAAALTERGVLVNALEEIPASTSNSKVNILQGIDESDFVVLILGTRYGTILPSMTDSHEISVTHWEYNEALKRGKSILAFIRKWGPDDANHPDKLDSRDNSFEHKQRKLTQFRNLVIGRHSERYAWSAEELAELVSKAIVPVYRARVKAALDEISTLKSELETATRASEGYLNLPKEMTSPLAQSPAPNNFGGLPQNIPNAGGGFGSSVNPSQPPTPSLGFLSGLKGLVPGKK